MPTDDPRLSAIRALAGEWESRADSLEYPDQHGERMALYACVNDLLALIDCPSPDPQESTIPKP